MSNEPADKIERILGIYTRLTNGETINKATEAIRYKCNERSIQRDIEDIRNYMDMQGVKNGVINSVIYDRTSKGYRIEKYREQKLTNPEVLAICKILLDSRAFTKEEISQMLDKLIDNCIPKENQALVKELIRNEEHHYIELQHKSVFLEKMWDIGNAIYRHQYVMIRYQGIQGTKVKTRKIKPLAIMFSEYYFYLAAFIDDEKIRENFDVLNDSFPTIYRIDRIQGYEIIDERFHIPYSDRFQEGEFRKRIQFMYGGKLRKVKFQYSGYSVEAVLDKLPTAKIIDETEHKEGIRKIYTITAEVFGNGIDMWLRSQGDNVNFL